MFKAYSFGFMTLITDSIYLLLITVLITCLLFPAYNIFQSMRYLKIIGSRIEVNRIYLLSFGTLPYFPCKETEFSIQEILTIESGRFYNNLVTITYKNVDKEIKLKAFLKNHGFERLTSVSS